MTAARAAAARASPRPATASRERVMIQIAWLWVKHQPESELTKWFHRRTKDQSKRVRRIMIVALARKLAIGLWRYLETGLIPEGAVLKAK